MAMGTEIEEVYNGNLELKDSQEIFENIQK